MISLVLLIDMFLAQEEEGLKRRRFRHREAKEEEKIREINFSDLKQL